MGRKEKDEWSAAGRHLLVDLQPADRVHQVGCGRGPAGVTVSRVTHLVSFVLGGLGQDGTHHPLQGPLCGNLPTRGNIVTRPLFSRMFPSENNTTTLAKEELQALLNGRRNRLTKCHLCGQCGGKPSGTMCFRIVHEQWKQQFLQGDDTG